MNFEAKYRDRPEPATLDLSDFAVETDAYDAAAALEAAAGFLRALGSLEHVDAYRDWFDDADFLETIAATLTGEVAVEALTRQQEAEGQ